jgi:hypothetical protein
MLQLPNWLIMIVLASALAISLWLFARTREDIYTDVEGCNFDDPRERLKELEAAFAAGLMTPEEFGRLSEKLGGEINRQTSGKSSRTLPKTWDDVRKDQ